MSCRFLAVVVALACSVPAHAQNYIAMWEVDDAEGSLAVQLHSDGSCRVIVRGKALDRATSISCTYWVHGSRINLRTQGQRAGEGLGEMDLEYVPQSDTVIIHGRTPRVLTRRPASIDG